MNYTVIKNYITTKLGDIDAKIFGVSQSMC